MAATKTGDERAVGGKPTALSVGSPMQRYIQRSKAAQCPVRSTEDRAHTARR